MGDKERTKQQQKKVLLNNQCLVCLIHPAYRCYICKRVWCVDCHEKRPFMPHMVVRDRCAKSKIETIDGHLSC